MFCSSCGNQLNPDSRFCNGCGTPTAGAASDTQPKPAPSVVANTTTIMAKSFRCNGCGASLKIPQNARGVMTCPQCKTECVLDGLIKNAEIAAKENIKSGIPLTATPATLHSSLVSLLSDSPSIPQDVFEKVEIIREEHYCVPAYQFYCTGTADFTYEKGVQKKQTYTVDRGDSVEVREKSHIEWNPVSSRSSVTETIFSPGNKKLAPQIQELYMKLDPEKLEKQLIDIEELSFPSDVETYSNNLTDPASFSEYVKPQLEMLLSEKAHESLKGDIRNFSMGGSNIQKDVVRIFMGLYRIIFKYGDKEYSMWATGDGKTICIGDEGLPVDSQRESSYNRKKADYDAASNAVTYDKKGIGCWFPGFIVLSILIAFGGGFSSGNTEGGIFFLLLAGVFVIPIILRNKKNNELDAEMHRAEAELREFDSPRKNAIEQFRKAKKACAGIYSKVSNDPEAF